MKEQKQILEVNGTLHPKDQNDILALEILRNKSRSLRRIRLEDQNDILVWHWNERA